MDGDRRAVGEDAAHLHLGQDVLDAVVEQTEVVVGRTEPDEGVVVGVQVVQEVGLGDLFGAQAAALLGAALEHGDAPAALGEIGGQGHAVVSRADDDCVEAFVEHSHG